jgi:hypothetical protein
MADQACNSLPVPPRLPRFIENLNSLALAHGLTVTMAVEPYENDPEIRLWGKWSGTRAQLLEIVQPVRSYHLPLACGQLTVPGGAGYCANPLITGTVRVDGDQVLYEVDFGPSDFSISEAAGVEIITSRKEIAYHGTAAALLAVGVDRSRLPLRKGSGKRGTGYGGVEWWSSRRQPDGSIVYRVESPAALRARRAERKEWERSTRRAVLGGTAPATAAPPRRPSHLRLVVDNDPPGES